MSDRLRQLSEAGVAIWLDDLSRERLVNGNLEGLARDRHVVGVTTNPTIFQTAISKSSAYDDDIAALAREGADVKAAVRKLTTDDVRMACDQLAPLVEATDGYDGRVSIEVDPGLAHDSEATFEEAVELRAKVDRPNTYIKIPATEAGLPAIRRALAEGISVNVTLIFSLERYHKVMDAFLAGIDDRLSANGSIDGLASVASFFVSRVDTEVDKRLEAIGSDAALALRGKAAVANARLAYQAYDQVFATDVRWARARAAGARPQRPLWASTGTKNPDYPDTLYVSELVVDGVVNTMPESTLEAFADHGEVRGDTVRPYYDDAQATLQAIRDVGVDLDEVFRVLEQEGIEKFETSWNDLLGTVGSALESGRG